MTYQIVTTYKTFTLSEEAFTARVEAGFFTIVGVTATLPPAQRRPMLCNQPKLKGMIGPCYGGEGVLRYESNAVYDILSR
jgi:hypothetical protein